MEANVGEENPAVFLAPGGSSAWGLQTPFYCRLDIEEHIFNAVFSLRSQNRIFFKTLSNILEAISSKPLVLICSLNSLSLYSFHFQHSPETLIG